MRVTKENASMAEKRGPDTRPPRVLAGPIAAMEMTRTQTITGPGPDRHALSILYECGCRECGRVMTYVAQMPAVLTLLRRYVERADQTLATLTPAARARHDARERTPGPADQMAADARVLLAALRDVEEGSPWTAPRNASKA
jgi:hypothetical protein